MEKTTAIANQVNEYVNALVALVTKADARDWYEDKPDWEGLMGLADRAHDQRELLRDTRKALTTASNNLEDLEADDLFVEDNAAAHALIDTLSSDMTDCLDNTIKVYDAHISVIEDGMEKVRQAYAHLPEGLGFDIY